MKLTRYHWLPNKYQKPLIAGSFLAKDLDEITLRLGKDLEHVSLWTWDEKLEGWKLEYGKDPEA